MAIEFIPDGDESAYDDYLAWLDEYEVIYLAGPMGNPANIDEHRLLLERIQYAAFVQGELIRASDNRVIINPYASCLYPQNFAIPRDKWIAQGIFIAGVIADAICLLPGWEDSPGCMEELQAALNAERTIYEWIDNVGMKIMQRGEA